MAQFIQKIASVFSIFCQNTSLPGWHYISQKNATVFQRFFWILTLLLSICITIFLLYNNTLDYLNSTIVTTLDSKTVPLSEIFFPSVVVCNLNQIRKSFFEELGIYENETITSQIYNHYFQ